MCESMYNAEARVRTDWAPWAGNRSMATLIVADDDID